MLNKRLFGMMTFLIGFLLILSLIACDKNSNNNKSGKTSQEQLDSSEQQTNTGSNTSNNKITKNSNSGRPRNLGDGFTIYDIPPEYNGKYAYAADTSLTVINNDEKDRIVVLIGGVEWEKAVRISNGSVTLPMWTHTNYFYGDGNEIVEKYTGNDSFDNMGFYIFDGDGYNSDELLALDLYSVTFSNGNAAESYTSGKLYRDTLYTGDRGGE